MTSSTEQHSTVGGHPPPIVEAVKVTKRFGATTALDSAELTVEPGEIHALVGRNGAGKSTLVSILTGLEEADAGAVAFSGRPAPPLSDRHAWRSIVACVYQKSTIIPELSVAENLFVNDQADAGRPISWRRLRSRAAELLAAWELDVDVRVKAKELTVEQRQMVEIARSLSRGARFIILDEPTARLDAAAINRLFSRVRALQEQGVTFLYISHHLQEIFELCQTVTVYRDARHIVTAPIAELPRAELVIAMTGEQVSETSDPRPPAPPPAEPILSVRGLTVGDACRDVDVDVRPGEIVGLAGAVSSGKFAVANAIVGLQRPSSGTVLVEGRAPRRGDVAKALLAGLGFVPQDRHREGFVGGMSMAENITMAVPHRLERHGVLSTKRRTELAQQAIQRLDIVPPRPEQPVAALSGGNQQKVVMARALADEPRLLVLMTPTAGVDVKAKQTLMDTAADAARNGSGVLVVSDDLDDLRYCHRVVVMFRGAVVGEFSGTWQDQQLVAAMEGIEVS
ncbi:MAG TPA: sugar ABC transporter ATP-binding protein [Jatrophihabitans sp.]|jgi:simple sugar transport system ATP-binding protein|nr:sugar ABC transporter ATP-binding protein [Jatrophihabitans sp.]